MAELSRECRCYYTPVLKFFSSEQHVKYPKPVEDSGLDLIRMFLKWPPKGRCTVRECLDHSFFGQLADLDAMLCTCSHEQLGKLVTDSITSGVPVGSVQILAAAAPVVPRGTKRPHTVESQSEAEVDASACKRTAPKRKQKTDCPRGVQDVNESLFACRGNCRSIACVKACNDAAL